MTEVKSISLGFHGADLPGEIDFDLAGYDLAASAQAYADILKETIEGAYPGAAVEVLFDLDATGALPSGFETQVNDLTVAQVRDTSEHEYIASLEADVYLDANWLVKTKM